MKNETMDHAYIREHNFIERYHLRRLAPEEEARFEAHFVGCPQCSEELELARGFEVGIKAVAAEEAARLESLATVGILARLGRAARRRPMAFAVAAALTASALTSVWFATVGRSPATRGTEAAEPLADLPVFILSAVRDPREPALTVDLRETGDWLSLVADVDDDPRFDGYRLTVLGAGGEALWTRGALLPNALETLMVTFPASFFEAGDYRLTVEGILPEGGAVDLDSYPFRVVGEN